MIPIFIMFMAILIGVLIGLTVGVYIESEQYIIDEIVRIMRLRRRSK